MLRDYQQDGLDASVAAFARGVWSQVAVLPTGAGKTVVFSHLPDAYAAWLGQFPERQQKMLVLAHREELLDQAAEKLATYNPALRVGVEKGDRRATPMDDVVVASVQTLTARGARRLYSLDPQEFRIVVVDEAHHAPADTYQQVLRYFDLLPEATPTGGGNGDGVYTAREEMRGWWKDRWPNRLLLGVTATPNRGDAVGLEWTFNELVFERTIRWMVQQGYLVEPIGFMLDTGLSLDAVKTVAGDFAQGQLAQVVNTAARNEQAVQAWLHQCPGRLTLAFTVDIQHALDLAAAYRTRGVLAEAVWGNDPQRHEKIAAFRRGELRVLTNCNVLTEGFDAPEVGAIVMARPTKSQSLYMQMVGRGLRLFAGKTDCTILDMVDTARRHSLVTLGDLFGLPRKFNLEGAGACSTADELDGLKAQHPDLPFEDGMDMAAVLEAIKAINLWAVADSEIANKFGKLKWVEEVAGEVYHLGLPVQEESGGLMSGQKPTFERVVIQQEMLGGFKVEVRGDGVVPVGMADDIASAFQKAERWVEHMRPGAYAMKQKDAPWRDRLASEKQIALLGKLGYTGDTAQLTRGMASDMIDKKLGKKK